MCQTRKEEEALTSVFNAAWTYMEYMLGPENERTPEMDEELQFRLFEAVDDALMVNEPIIRPPRNIRGRRAES